MKTTFRFNCGDLVRHKTEKEYGTKFLIIARGVFEDIDGIYGTMYVVSFSHMGGTGRAYLNEHELDPIELK